MSTVYLSDGFSTNQVVGAVVKAMLRDLRVNNFTFCGFPAVNVHETDNTFHISLRIQDHDSKSLVLKFDEAKKIALRFQDDKDLDRSFVTSVQGLIEDLEIKSSKKAKS